MWILLFAAVLSVAICLSLVAIFLSPITQGKSLDSRNERPGFVPDPPKLSRAASHDVETNRIRLNISDDVRLLLRRMALLALEPHELNRADPLVFRELQGRCSLCPSKAECRVGLAREAADGRVRDWGEYCPNAAALNFLHARFCSVALRV